MNVRELKEYLEDIPEDYDICLSKFVVLDVTKEQLEEAGDDPEDAGLWEIILDHHVNTIAVSDESQEVRFMFVEELTDTLKNLGKVVKL